MIKKARLKMKKLLLISIVFVCGCYDSSDYYYSPAIQNLNNQKYALENEAQNLLREDKRQRHEYDLLVQKEDEIRKDHNDLVARFFEFNSTLNDEQQKKLKYWWFNRGEEPIDFLAAKPTFEEIRSGKIGRLEEEQISTILKIWAEEIELSIQAAEAQEKRKVLVQQQQENIQAAKSLQYRYEDYQKRQRLIYDILLAQEQYEQRYWQNFWKDYAQQEQQRQQQLYQWQIQDSLRGIEIGIMNLRPGKVQILR